MHSFTPRQRLYWKQSWLSTRQEPTQRDNRNNVPASDRTICKLSSKAPTFAHCSLATRCQDQGFLAVSHLILTESADWSYFLYSHCKDSQWVPVWPKGVASAIDSPLPATLTATLLCSQNLRACCVLPYLDGSSHSSHLLLPHFMLPFAQQVLPQEQFPGDCLSKSQFLSLSETLLYSQISSVFHCAHYYLT